jgi:hypothetical protein
MPRSTLRSRPKRAPLSIEEILLWADEWFAAHGEWPNINSGEIPGTLDDTWARIDDSLRNGHRELPKKSGLSLARLLEKRRGVRNSEYPPRLSVSQITRWAKAFHRRTGKWPKEDSGPIPEAVGETWLAIDMALRKGRRGLPEGSSLPRLLAALRRSESATSSTPHCDQDPAMGRRVLLAAAQATNGRFRPDS